MNEDDDEYLILDNLIRYADHHKGFDRKFIDGCYEFREVHNQLTYSQLEVLSKIFYMNNVQDFIDTYYGYT
jgi:hypothetical protein